MVEIFYSWENFNQDILLIVSKISSSNWIPDCIVGIKRGGLVPAVKLSHVLYKPLYTISCQQRDSKDIDVYLYEINEICKDKKLLIVDDICDSGETFEKIDEELKKNQYKNFKFCSLYYNVRQNFVVDYKARKIDREKEKKWVVFPWEI